MRNLLTTLAEVLGMCLVIFGVGLYSVPACLITAGVALLAVGMGVEL